MQPPPLPSDPNSPPPMPTTRAVVPPPLSSTAVPPPLSSAAPSDSAPPLMTLPTMAPTTTTDEVPPQPVKGTATPPTGRKFPCRQCGARIEFDPKERGLKCPYCGFVEVIAEADDDEKASVKEHDLEEYLAKQEAIGSAKVQAEVSEVRCPGCGAVVILSDKVQTDRCVYCGTHLENKPQRAENLIQPESLLPFQISDRDAKQIFSKWINGLWFAPTELKKLATLGRFSSVYAPYWTYDSMTYTRYTGERGINYTETEYYTDANGNRQSRTVTKTRWYPVSGEVPFFFDDVLIPGSKTLPMKLVKRLQPWDLKNVEPYQDHFLSGHSAERYSVSLLEGFHEAKEVMENYITTLIRQDIGGDQQRIHTRKTQYVGVTFKHTLLPTWVAHYRYREKVFQVLVNGQSGKLAGERPWSVWKIIRLIVIIILLGSLLIWVGSAVTGKKKGGATQPQLTPPSLQTSSPNRSR